MKFLKGKRTYIVAGLMVAVAIINLITGETAMADLLVDPNIRMLLEGLGGGFLRAGMEK